MRHLSSVVCISEISDPWANLAIEQQLLDDMQPNERILFLWINRPTVVIGRHQNPWLECRVEALASFDVWLARRPTGGGTVYHDHGNLNYSILVPREAYDRDRCYAMATEALQRLGIAATRNDRNDILVHDRKVSGSAFRFVRDRVIHHGTLLVDANVEMMSRCLGRSNALVGAHIETSAVRSTPHPVINLVDAGRDITMERVREACIQAIGGDNAIRRRIGPEANHDPTLTKRIDLLKSWEWVYGKTPTCTVAHSMHDARTTTQIHVVGGYITDIIFPDDYANKDTPTIAALRAQFIGTRYDPVLL